MPHKDPAVRRAAQRIARAKYRRAYPERVRASDRKYNWKRRGIPVTASEYDRKMIEQNGRCAICGKEEWRGLAQDHDHQTKFCRALLCTRCNTQLGVYEQRASEFVNYLARYRGDQLHG